MLPNAWSGATYQNFAMTLGARATVRYETALESKPSSTGGSSATQIIGHQTRDRKLGCADATVEHVR